MLFSRNELKPLLSQVSTNDPDLTSLHLSHKKITNKQLLQISDALQQNSNVTEIWLTNNQISDGDCGGGGGGAGSVGYLMSVLESNRSVGEVYLGGNKIGAKGASSIANLLQKNNILTDIGLEDNDICDGGAKMLADALSHNTCLQTLKLAGNNIQTEATLTAINDKLKMNKEEAKKKFELEHPELATHKLKKPPPKEEEQKKKKNKSSSRSSRSSNSNSSGHDGKRRSSGHGERKRRSKESSSSSSSGGGDGNDGSSSKRTSSKDANVETCNAILEERENSTVERPSIPTTKPGLKDKFKGLALGGGGGGGNNGKSNDAYNGVKGATFV